MEVGKGRRICVILVLRFGIAVDFLESGWFVRHGVGGYCFSVFYGYVAGTEGTLVHTGVSLS